MTACNPHFVISHRDIRYLRRKRRFQIILNRGIEIQILRAVRGLLRIRMVMLVT